MRLLQLSGKFLHTLGNGSSRQISDDKDLRFCARVHHGLGGIILTVGTGEHGNQNLRPAGFCRGADPGLGLEGDGLYRNLGVRNITRIHRFQLLFVGLLQGYSIYGFSVPDKPAVRADGTQHLAHRLMPVQLQNKAAIGIAKQILHGDLLIKVKAEPVAKGHFHHCLCRAAHTGGVCGHRRAGAQELGHQPEMGQQRLGIGQPGLVVLRLQQADGVTRRLELIGYNVLHLLRGDSKGHQGWRHIQVFKGTGHRVLPTNGGDFQILLGLKGAQEGCQGLAPPLGIPAHPLEILLEGEVYIFIGCAGGHQFGGGLHHRQVRSVIGAPLGNKWVVAPGHEGTCIGVSLLQAHLVDHGLDGGLLMLAAEGHEHSPGSNGGVKPLRQAPLGAGVQVCGNSLQILQEAAKDRLGIVPRCIQLNGDVLLCAVGV